MVPSPQVLQARWGARGDRTTCPQGQSPDRAAILTERTLVGLMFRRARSANLATMQPRLSASYAFLALGLVTLASCGGNGGEGADAANADSSPDASQTTGDSVDIGPYLALGEDLCDLVSLEAVAGVIGNPVDNVDFTKDVSAVCSWNFASEPRTPTLVLTPDTSYADAVSVQAFAPGPPGRETEVAGRPAFVSPADPDAGEFAQGTVYVQLTDSPDGAYADVFASTEEKALALAELLTPALLAVR